MQVSDDGGKTFRRDGGEGQALRQPRDRLPQGRPRLPARRHRRRDLREPRPRDDLALRGEPARDPVLQDRGGRRRALLQRLRGDPGQQHPGRPLAHRHLQRNPERRLVHHPLRRRLPAGHRARQPRHPVLRVAAGEPRARGPHDRRAGLHPAPARAGRPRRALQLGRADPREPALAEAALLRLAARVALRRPGRQLARGLGRPHAEPGPHDPPLHGPAVELGLAVGHDGHVHLQHDHLARRVAEGGGAPLRRDRRRAPPGLGGRREELAEGRGGVAARRSGERLRQRHQGRPPRRGHRLRRPRRPQVRRLPALPPEEHRPRAHVALDRRRPARAGTSSGASSRTT